MKNWKTTIFGILFASAGAVASSPTLGPDVQHWAGILGPVFGGLFAVFARDKDVSTEESRGGE